MDIPDIQAELARRHGITIPPDDPSFIQASICEIMLSDTTKRLDASAGRVERSVRWMSGGPKTNWRLILISAGVLVGTLLAGSVAGWIARGASPVLAGLRAGPDHCDERADGSRVCWIPIYERLPRSK